MQKKIKRNSKSTVVKQNNQKVHTKDDFTTKKDTKINPNSTKNNIKDTEVKLKNHNVKGTSGSLSSHVKSATGNTSTHKKTTIKQRRKMEKKVNKLIKYNLIAMLVLLCIMIPFFLHDSTNANRIQITLKVQDTSIIQGEALPVFEYTIQNFVDELNQGIGYTLSSDGDGSTEGNFPIKVEFTEDTSAALEKWNKKIYINVEAGNFCIKNQYGEWEGEKFKRWDDTYVTEEFITYQNKVYYFDKEGNKSTGWQVIQSNQYYFDESGVMQKGWLQLEENTYYLDEKGIMQIGWLQLENEKYYLNSQGKMLTGEQRLGTKDCVFAEDGKLVSEATRIDVNQPMVALTFDDGPGYRTMELLEALESYGAKATFFMLGENISLYADAVKKMEQIGCELGNHTYSHARLTKLNPAGIKSQIQDTNNKIANVTGKIASVMRPPYGSVDDKVKANVGLPLIMWTVDTLDWETKNVQSTIDSVMSNLDNGEIILMHDIHSQTIDAAIAMIPKIIDEGYQLVTVTELAEARNISLKDGEKYFSFPK